MTLKSSSNQSPTQQYARDLAAGIIFPDSAQAKAIDNLQLVYDSLLDVWKKPPSLWQTFMDVVGTTDEAPVQGLYFWGGVGRGKTYLMDLFYQCLPGQRKMRMHFHRFMQLVHRGLHEHRGKKNPLNLVAESISQEVDVICFDEFFVSDIGDAMILANLLEALLDSGVILIATSNIPPDSLYENGLQRARFLPAIELIKQYSQVINMDGGVDYRLRRLEQAEIFHTPLNELAEKSMMTCFSDMTGGDEIGAEAKENVKLEILGRDVLLQHWAEGIAWFNFNDICDGPRSAADYIEIAQLFHTVFVANIPVMGVVQEEGARRFISLVDEFYDHNVKLIISAAAPIEGLYQGSELSFPFERTRSRLLEMQSHDYLALEHNP